MSLVDQVKANRRVDLRKLKKEILIDKYIKAEDFFVELEDKISSLKKKHEEDIKAIESAHNETIHLNEEYYTKSNSYDYVKQILEELEKLSSEKEWYRIELENLQQNGHEDLRKEITLLKNKIVRMA